MAKLLQGDMNTNMILPVEKKMVKKLLQSFSEQNATVN